MPKLGRKLLMLGCLGLAAWGAVSLVLLGLAFTPIPGRIYHWLAAQEYRPEAAPDVIVLVGGTGIPSGPGLLRAYYTAELALRYPQARVIVCQTADPEDPDSDLVRVRGELELRGVPAGRVVSEPRGRNTREQALRVAELLGSEASRVNVVVVTSAFHVRRTVLAFRRAGISRTWGVAAYDTMRPVELGYEAGELGGEAVPLAPDVGENLFLRYGLWRNLHCEIYVAAELCGLLYYRLRGWI